MGITRNIGEIEKRIPFISSLVKSERLKLELKQVDFARKIGIGLKTLRKIEQGDLNISFQKLNYVLNCIGHELAPSEIVTRPIKKESKKLLKTEVISILENAIPIFKRKYSVKNMYLFGSYAIGRANKSSDIDVLINVNGNLKFEEEEEIKLILESLFKGKDVDLAIEKNLLNEFKKEILENRIEIKERL